MTTSGAEEEARADWSVESGVLSTNASVVTPCCPQPPFMMSIASNSLLRLAMASEMFEHTGTFPVFSPNAGVSVS